MTVPSLGGALSEKLLTGQPSIKTYMFLPPLPVTTTSTKRTTKRGPSHHPA